MDYQEELRAKLDAIHANSVESNRVSLDFDAQEKKLLDELSDELELSQYDLQESDILRALKIDEILAGFGDAFMHKSALKLFYILCRIDVIEAKKLLQFSELDVKSFKHIINGFAKQKLVFKNETSELELTMDGKSLASRIGMDIFF